MGKPFGMKVIMRVVFPVMTSKVAGKWFWNLITHQQLIPSILCKTMRRLVEVYSYGLKVQARTTQWHFLR